MPVRMIISNPKIMTGVLMESSSLCNEVSFNLGFVIPGGVDVAKIVTRCDLIRVVYLRVASSLRRVVVVPWVIRGFMTGGVVA